MADLTITTARPVNVIEQFTGPSAEVLTLGQYARFNVTTGKIELGNATNAAEARDGGIVITPAEYAGAPVTIVSKGLIDVGNALSALTYDDDVFLSDTDGTLADAAGTVSKIVATVVPANGATTADKLLRVDL